MRELGIFIKKLQEEDEDSVKGGNGHAAAAAQAFALVPVFFELDPSQIDTEEKIRALYTTSEERGGFKGILEKSGTVVQDEWPHNAAYAVSRCGLREKKVSWPERYVPC